MSSWGRMDQRCRDPRNELACVRSTGCCPPLLLLVCAETQAQLAPVRRAERDEHDRGIEYAGLRMRNVYTPSVLMPQSVYLDSQCFAYLFGQPVFTGWTRAGAQDLREAVLAALRKDQIVMYGSHFHLEEASRIPDDLQRRRFLEFFWDAVSWYVLLPGHDLAKEEARVCRRLEGAEPFEDFWTRQRMRRLSRNPASLDELGQMVVNFVDQNVAAATTRRGQAIQRYQALYANMTPAQVTRRWWQDAEAHIDDWVRDHIANSKHHLELGNDPAVWPSPRDLPTVWAIYSYQMARIVMNVGLGRTIGDGDAHDAQHFANACYADIFVTEDGGFRDTLAIIPNIPVTVLSFCEFAAQFGVRPH